VVVTSSSPPTLTKKLLECHDEGYAAAMASGDVLQAALNKMLSCASSSFAGANLQIVRNQYAEAIKFTKERKQVIFSVQMQHFQHTTIKLTGTNEEANYVSDEEQNILATNTSVMTTYFYGRAYTSFMFRSYDDTKHYAEKYLACISNTWANLFLAHAHHSFYIGLINFWLARKSRWSSDGQQWCERGNRSKLAKNGQNRPSGHLRINGTCWKQRNHIATMISRRLNHTMKKLYLQRKITR